VFGKPIPDFNSNARALRSRSLDIDYASLLRLFHNAATFPILANLVIYQAVWGDPFDEPDLVVFIGQQRETLQSVILVQHANDTILAALEDCPRLKSLSLGNQDHVVDPTGWIRQYEQLWSRLYTMSLEDDYSVSPATLETTTTNGLASIQCTGINPMDQIEFRI